jgi:cell division protein FtsQ
MPPHNNTQPALYRVGTTIYRIIQLSVTCALLFALIYGWRWLSDPEEFPIRSVKIEATREHVDQKAIQAQVLPYVTQGFIQLNVNEIKEKLLELPWIAEARVERIWPDTVIIHIVEQKAVARWGKIGVLNSKGSIFNPPEDTIPADLPLLNGPYDQTAALVKNYEQIADILKPLGLSLHKLDMDERLSLQLELSNGTQLVLGKIDPLPRLERFAKVYPKIFAQPNAQAVYVDLRYENGLSIKWRASDSSTNSSTK